MDEVLHVVNTQLIFKATAIFLKSQALAANAHASITVCQSNYSDGSGTIQLPPCWLTREAEGQVL